ncbi:MAG: ABC transporter substrate-binding protein [Alphaproteobacteria bacterium]
MKKLLGTSLIIFASYGMISSADTITYGCQQTDTSKSMCDYLDARWKEMTNGEHDSRRVDIPWDSNDQLALMQQGFAVKSGDIDIFLVDVVWPGLIGEHLLNLNPYGGEEVLSKHIAGYAKNNTINGEVKAIPSFMDTGMLYYRKDLLEKYGKQVPQTWDELKETAQYIMDEERKAGNKNMWGYVFQGKAYEGLTCNALEWFVSYGAGHVIEPDGTISINNEEAAKALDVAASFVGTISPDGVTGMTEEESRNVFQAGNAVFHRNWPYVWALANGDDSPVKGKVAITAMPKGDANVSASALGGWSNAANAYSKHPDLAAKFLFMMNDEESQRKRYEIEGNNPTMSKLYDEPEFENAKVFLPAFENAEARPSSVTGARYNEVSNEIWNAAFNVITGKQDGKAAVADLEKRLKKIKEDSRNWKR